MWEKKMCKTATPIRAFKSFALSQKAHSTMREHHEISSIIILTRLASKVKTVDVLYAKKYFPVR